jgi:long-chain acyl-CoA synthetase
LIPSAAVLHQLRKAIGGDTAFCVTDSAIRQLDGLDRTQFATLTGGTSGTPKVIARSQASWISSFKVNQKQFGYTSDDSIAVLGGLGHSLALYGVLEGLHLGLDVHVLSAHKPVDAVKHLRAAGCTILYATPTQLRILPASNPLPEVRLILCGGGALSTSVRDHICALAPHADVRVFYGAAETSFVTLGDAATPEGSVGRPFFGVEIKIRNSDTSGTGQVWVRSPYLFDGYVEGNSPHTQREGEWLTVGEYGRIDAAGHIVLRGRAGRAINSADTIVFPEELESRICDLAQLAHCAVLARPDALRGQHIIVVLQGADDPEMRAQVIAHCKAAGLMVPRAVVFLDPFPLLPSGKADMQRIAFLTQEVP